jgi:hypothetical protein
VKSYGEIDTISSVSAIPSGVRSDELYAAHPLQGAQRMRHPQELTAIPA